MTDKAYVVEQIVLLVVFSVQCLLSIVQLAVEAVLKKAAVRYRGMTGMLAPHFCWTRPFVYTLSCALCLFS